MPTLILTDEQVVELVRQLPAERRRAALVASAGDATQGREERMKHAELRLRRCYAERGAGLGQDVRRAAREIR